MNAVYNQVWSYVVLVYSTLAGGICVLFFSLRINSAWYEVLVFWCYFFMGWLTYFYYILFIFLCLFTEALVVVVVPFQFVFW
jgi:hypothetical protein